MWKPSSLQQAEVAELNRRAQHAEQESSAARAEAAAVRQAAAQQQAERAIAQYSQATRMAGQPFQDAQGASEYDPLPGLAYSRYVCWPSPAVLAYFPELSAMCLRQQAPSRCNASVWQHSCCLLHSHAMLAKNCRHHMF